MKVLFTKFLANVWHEWDIKEVSHAYGTNFLIPKWYAKVLIPAEEKNILKKKKEEEQKRKNLVLNKHKIVETLNNKEFVFVLEKWNNNKVFGSVKERDIITKIKKEFKIELSKKHIDMWPDGHLKKIGSTFVYIKLTPETQAKITVTIK